VELKYGSAIELPQMNHRAFTT